MKAHQDHFSSSQCSRASHSPGLSCQLEAALEHHYLWLIHHHSFHLLQQITALQILQQITPLLLLQQITTLLLLHQITALLLLLQITALRLLRQTTALFAADALLKV